MKRLKFEELKELPLSKEFMHSEREKILEKAQRSQNLSIISYLFPAISFIVVTFVLITNIRENKKLKIIQTYDNIYFYQFMEILEYMDILEKLTEEDLK